MIEGQGASRGSRGKGVYAGGSSMGLAGLPGGSSDENSRPGAGVVQLGEEIPAQFADGGHLPRKDAVPDGA